MRGILRGEEELRSERVFGVAENERYGACDDEAIIQPV